VKLSVVYSFYNEEENLKEVIRRTRLVIRNKLNMAGGDYEIVFVNDSSNDRSEEIILDEMKSSSDLKLVNTTRNFGNAACILAGFAFTKGKHVGYLDTDLQDPPELLEMMYKTALADGVDIIHTQRTKRNGESRIKMFITKIGYAILGFSLDVPLQPNTGDYKLLSRRAVEAVLRLNEPLPFMRGIVSYVGFKSKIVQYERDGRFAGDTHFPVFSRKVISNFINNAFVSYSDLPIHLIIYLSVFGLFMGLLISIYALYIKIGGAAVPGSVGVILAVTTFSSLIMLCIGTLGLYLASIKKAVLRRPAYIIESVKESQEPLLQPRGLEDLLP
jgi:glycosyltransferase involved in cell wall biosynthesis